MRTILSHLRHWRHVLLTPPAALPDPYSAFTWDHDPDPLNWPQTERAEYTGYVHAFEFLAAADARRNGGRR